MFEMMILVLAGKSAAVVKVVEKELKPYVTQTRVIRRK
jgi:hypothetical protein